MHRATLYSLTEHLRPHYRLSQRSFSQARVNLAGHNKWSKIKDKKAANDAKRGAVTTKAIKEIAVAIRTGASADPELNKTLANALRAARAAGVTKENIEKALARVGKEGGKDGSTHVVYEAMAYGSVGVIAECLTDNTTRTVARIREVFNDFHCRLAPVKYLFDRIGRVQVTIPSSSSSSSSSSGSEGGANDREMRIEKVLEAAGSAGGEDFDIVEGSDVVEYFCAPDCLDAMTKAISDVAGSENVVSSEAMFRAKEVAVAVAVDDGSLVEKVGALREALEENEDCVRVWTTLDARLFRPDE